MLTLNWFTDVGKTGVRVLTPDPYSGVFITAPVLAEVTRAA